MLAVEFVMSDGVVYLDDSTHRPAGAGKSTVGPALAARLACPFLDLDREFERRNGDIDVFIAEHGYPAYARANVEAYIAIARDRPTCVLALSSGFLVYPASVHAA